MDDLVSEVGLGIADIVVFCVLTAVGYFVGLYFSFKGRGRQYLRMRFDNKVGITACVVYFLLTGGLRGVVWADCAQAVVMFFSPIVIIAKVLYDANTVTPPLRPMTDANVKEMDVPGAGCATLLVCLFLLWHAVGRGLSEIPPVPVLPKSLDRCPLQSNASGLYDYSAAVEGIEDDARSNVFPLYSVSFYWISFIGALLTIFLGTALSLLTGGHKTAKRNVRLTSPVFLNVWKRFRFLRRTMALQGDEIKNKPTLIQPEKRDDENEKDRNYDTELHPILE
ncbi:hypothetical protein MTO96_005987 [Rhipicephalus appendiculatus]